jgi:hypothetical protein
MAEKEIADITERLVALGSPQKIKAVLSSALIALKAKEAKDKEEEREREKTTSQLGNSDEVIAQLKKDYNFSKVPPKELKEAEKWFLMKNKPSSSRSLAPEVSASYYQWLKWNHTATGNLSQTYKGHLIIKREETEAGAAMAAAAAVGAAMAAVKLE